MKLVLFFSLLISSFGLSAEELKWNCDKVTLRFNETPGSVGKDFSVDGCYQSKTYFLISHDCKKSPSVCLKNGEKKIIEHPAGGVGSPGFVQCYRAGGRPRFLQVKANGQWMDTYTCFFGSQNSFMDYDTISLHKK